MLASRVEGDRIFVIPKPLQQRTFMGAVRLALGFSNRFIEMERKRFQNMKRSMKNCEWFPGAKCVLIEKEDTVKKMLIDT